MSDFSKRIISGIVYVALFLFAIIYGKESYIGLITFFAGVCIWEFSRMLKVKNILPYILLGLLSFTIVFNKLQYFEEYKVRFALVVYTLVSSLLLIKDLFSIESKKIDKISSFFLPIKYIILPFFFLMLLPFIKSVYVPTIIIYTIVIIWTNDSFAYLVGKNFGKHKLFERISPKKTIEGFIGGLLFSIIAGAIISFYSPQFSIVNWIIIAVIISVFGTLGDLVESKFKRQAGIKDSGTIMPGHGGLLDRLDSLFFLAPYVYAYIHFLL